ncbi:methylmalonyl-CoA mutase family protein [uncultured Enterovirga sp.]|uniref:methylmalonyl-CoA mutase family protein n=1 Tax=uncultured Enterovirga sp. TaxID=2026352 RepID=UPI0035C9548D
MDDLALASEFPAASREAWASAVERVLKGADPERLVGRSADGIRIEPIYPKAEFVPSGAFRPAAPWRVAARVDHPDPAEANSLALADLEGGADALVLSLAGAPAARGFGLQAANARDLDRAFAGVRLELIALSIETPPFAGLPAAEMFAALAAQRGHAPADLTVDFGLDPIGDIARSGAPPLPWPDLAARFAATAASVQAFRGSAARIDTRPYHEAGASEAQELAAALATGVAYLRALEAGGLTLEQARDALAFTLVANADEFLTVSKFRALRRLWSQVEAACGLEPAALRLHAETAWRMTTRRDPWVNLLRGTLASFSAGIGGADSIAVLPLTSALGLPDAFARRLARNTQLILMEETNLWRVADPVAGSGAFEALSEALSERAWTLFQEIESEGGIVQSLEAGALQGRVADIRAAREAAVATRRDPLTGTSEFPNIREAPVRVLLPSPPDRAAATMSGDATQTPFRALPSVRAAQPFEALRDRSDHILARSGHRPRVFLANLGPVSAFSARAMFARNAFEAGGIEALDNEGFSSLDDLAAAFRAADAPLACLCSSDEIYTTQSVAAARRLKQAGAAKIYLAGRPGDLADALREAGVDAFIHVGGDLASLLGSALDSVSS